MSKKRKINCCSFNIDSIEYFIGEKNIYRAKMFTGKNQL
ncbi:MAG: hypothetical protein ACI90V_010831 [Bacillariaceae sp.]|jgi:hypothetical protein